MSQPPVPDAELAKTGDPAAIAALLNRLLLPRGITASADRQGGQFNLRFLSPNLPPPESLAAFVQAQLHHLQVEAITAVRLFGYQPHQPMPLWTHLLQLEPSPQSGAQGNGSAAVAAAPQSSAAALRVDYFLVCGLGDLGQYCVLNLKRFALGEFEIYVRAIDKVQPSEWEVPDVPNLLAEAPILGDCRDDQVLMRAGVQDCRAVLLVTSNESVNVEAAIAVRRLNPHVRLIIRSSRHSLNQLLKQQLGNFVAFDPTELPAATFALEGLQEGVLGCFNVGDCRLQVVEQQVPPKDFRFDGILAATMHKKTYRLLSYRPAAAPAVPARAFYQWRPDTKVKAEDTIAYVEVIGQTPRSQADLVAEEPWWQQRLPALQMLLRRGLQPNLAQLWQWLNAERIRQLVGIGLVVAVLLWLLGTGLLLATVPGIGAGKAASTAAILLLGGYGDVFGGLGHPDLPVPPWVQAVCLLITIASLASVLGVLGLITETLLSSQFNFLRKRPPLPKQNHVVLVGLGRVGQRVATLLQEFKQPVVAITEHPDSASGLPPLPLLVGNPIAELAKVNLARAKSVIVVTDDQMLNLEVALMAREAARQAQRQIGLVVRTYSQRFSNHLSNLLPDAKAMAAYGLSAAAFAGAAFGENVLGLFRLNNQTILVTEYTITMGDRLVGKLLAQVAYGYGVVPIFHQRANQAFAGDPSEFLMPSDDRQLQVGDRLVLLASMNGLRRIEQGDIAPPRRWQLTAQPPLNRDTQFASRNLLVRISGCSIEATSRFIDSLPGSIELKLYDYQADRLLSALTRQLPGVVLVPLD